MTNSKLTLDVLGMPGHLRACVMWADDSARYHVWVDAESGEPEGTIYKNAPLGTAYQGEGYFHTRRLDASARKHTQLMADIRAIATPEAIAQEGLVRRTAVLAAEAQEAREFETEVKEAMVRCAIDQDHGPLRAALADMGPHQCGEYYKAIHAAL